MTRAEPKVQIFGTDIDKTALQIARAARYPAALLEAVEPPRLQRFFVADGGSFVLAKPVRDMAVRRAQRHPRHALLADRPDLVPQSPDLSRRPAPGPGLPTFHYALRSRGYLFLGRWRT